MAPLFSALVFIPAAAVLLSLAFAVARFFQPTSMAIRIAFVFVVGSAMSAGIMVVGLAFFVNSTLTESWQVIAYLSSVAVGTLFGGAALVFLFLKLCVLNQHASASPAK